MRVIRKDEISTPFISTSGERIYEMIGRPAELGGTANHSFVHVVIPVSGESPAHYHKVSEETYYILRGKGRFVLDGQECVVEPGDACLIMPPQVHQLFNIGDDELEFLTVSGPAFNPDDYFLVDQSA